MRLVLPALAAAAALAAGPAAGQQPGVPAPEAAAAAPQPAPPTLEAIDDARVNQLIVYGDDPCPPSTAEEIIVCARLPEDDRYRIPPNLREDPNAPENQAWANRAIELSYVGRTGTDSCSTVGPGGFTGCFTQIVRQARAERAGAADLDWNRLIEQARQERMRRIGEVEVEEGEAEPDSPE